MAKFVIIDGSIIDLQGHYYEYAIRVLEAAQKAGYTPILATNRRFERDGSIPWEVYPVYKYGFWFHMTKPRWHSWLQRVSFSIRRMVFIPKIRMIFSRWGLLWIARKQPGEYLRLRSLDAQLDVSLILLGALVYLMNILSSIKPLLWEAIPFRGYLGRVFAYAKRLMITSLSPILLFIKPKDWMLECLWNRVKMRQFGRDTQRLFRKVRLEQGDIVFLPLASAPEIMGLLQYFQRDPSSINAAWHSLFRHQLYIDRDALPTLESTRRIQRAFIQFLEGLHGRKVYFYTDTDELTRQYNSLGIVRFETLPIPISEEFHELRRGPVPHGSLRIAYVGDARKEKGYHHLPQIVQDLWEEYVKTGRVKFVIQSNFNIPGGTAQTVVARMQLESYSRDRVTLLTEPLGTDEYRDLIVNADITLLPYDRDAYYARSSGILAEALAAGVPVIVPSGTWMAKQFADEVYRYHEKLEREWKILKSRNGVELRWRFAGEAYLNPMSCDGRLGLGTKTKPVYTILTVPRSARWLLLSFGPTNPAQGLVRVYTDQIDAKGTSLRRREVILSESPHARASMLLPLVQGVQRIYLDLAKASVNATSELSDIRVHFFAEHPGPQSAVGLIYDDPDDITDLLREMIENYRHYRETAQAFAVKWFSIHNADHSIAKLKAASEINNAYHIIDALPNRRLQSVTGKGMRWTSGLK